MEFLEGFEEDDNPQLLDTSKPASNGSPSLLSFSPGLQGLLNSDGLDGSSSSNSKGNKPETSTATATSMGGQPVQSSLNGHTPSGSADDEITLTGFSMPSSSSQNHQAVNGSGRHPSQSTSGSQQGQQGTFASNTSSDVFSPEASRPFLAQISQSGPPSGSLSRPIASMTSNTMHPPTTMSQSNGSYDYLTNTSSTDYGGSSLGRIPIIGGAGGSGSRTPGTPYGSTSTSNSTLAAGPYGSSFPYASSQPYDLSQPPSAGLHSSGPSYFGNQSYSQHPIQTPNDFGYQHPPQIRSSSKFTSSSTGFGAPNYASGSGSYSIPTPTHIPSPSTSSHVPSQSSRQPGRQSRSNASSTVIDLTEYDDNDTGSTSNNDFGNGTSVNSGGSDDEVKISSEKLHLKAPEEEDDDLELVGERPNEATNPVCIGQLSGVALILYPIAELCPPRDKPQTSSASLLPPTSLTVALLRTTTQMPSSNGNETIKLYSAQTWENFGVVEHRLANVLGPIMTRDNKRGMGVWVEAKVTRSRERSPMMLPLTMLLFCHPHLVKAVAQILEKSAIYLEHPPTYDPAMHGGFKYSNPHGGAITASAAAQRKQSVMNGTQGSYGTSGYSSALSGSRYGGGQVGAVKSVEVQREQVEEMFKSIQSGADLGEAEPSPLLNTKLYPHQKQALAFLLDRERLRTVDGVLNRKNGNDEKSDLVEDGLISLWKPRKDLYGRFIGWQHVVTEVEIGSDRPPPQCRGAILADDMGLGKTLVIIALIAGTLSEAKAFASQPPVKKRGDRESFDALAAHPMGKPVSLSEFKSPLYGQSGGTFGSFRLNENTGKGGKKKKESKTQKKREDAEVARLDKLQVRSKGTLIVCPLSTVVNWESQIEEHIGLAGKAAVSKKKKKGEESRSSTPADGLSIYIYHGNNRTNDLAELASYDVVLTTFSTLGSEYSRQSRKEQQDEEGTDSSESGIEELDKDGQPMKQKGKKRKRKKIEGDAISPLQQIEWFRIVLDEAHMIKEHTTIQARAACELLAERRICLTGTPLQNTLNDLFSLMRFLRLEPFTDRTMWTNYIGAPAKIGDPLGVSRLQLLMRHLALRRTKQTKDKAGKPILEIPEKKDELRYVELDEQEKAFYTSHHRRYKHNFEMLQKNDTLLKNYCSILQEVLRLRQICAHMALVRDSEDRADALKGDDAGDVVSAIKAHGISKSRALRLLALMRDTGAAQCDECGQELAPGGLDNAQDTFEDDSNKKPRKIKGVKKEKQNGAVKRESEETSNPSPPSPVLTRCQHLFCLECFQKNVAINFPDAVTASDRATCSVCKEEISPVIDAIQVSSSEIDTLGAGDGDEDTTSAGRARRVVEHSTKIRALIQDLFPLSQNNPASANYAGDSVDLSACDEDPKFRPEPREATKTVVFSQWTKLLDRCEDGLQECNIKFERLEGSMNRAERSRALATFKADLSCEVLLVSLRAGGVGLNLTHASRAYLMEPSWNPSVENQAVDRVHRLGATRPVKCVRFIVKDSIEANMLEIQKRKAQLANMSLSQTLSKAQLAERRMEDLRTLFK